MKFINMSANFVPGILIIFYIEIKGKYNVLVHTMKAYRGVGIQLHLLLNLILDGCSGQVHPASALPLG
jgi:hypothetical protein